ncbi:VOC family protein [Diaphorobacter sp. HDW4B]|uniref:VOC family protein n=1 Tax=Diaphorobacter sp. HDW4B TaxID=2714925 RepID=UPI00140DB353|nr:VOC family protein [Diaphorobacter sp. HDW4B]QIL70703.1 VOC family protein [Diaphorobacter sp. HDW4B]
MHHSLDHVVIAVDDLSRSIEQYRALGFTVYPGGDHQGRSSHNALIMLADGSYLELKAWRSPAPQERWWATLDKSGEGLVDFALLSADPVGELAAARARGLTTLQGPVPGERMRPDGQHVRWTTARHDTGDVPFLCGDITPRNLRVPDDAALMQHANGATGVALITVAVQDLDVTLARWQALLGPDFALPAISDDAALGIRSVRIALAGFDVILQGLTSENSNITLAKHLALRGEGAYEVVLRGTTAKWASPAAEHGFRS